TPGCWADQGTSLQASPHTAQDKRRMPARPKNCIALTSAWYAGGMTVQHYSRRPRRRSRRKPLLWALAVILLCAAAAAAALLAWPEVSVGAHGHALARVEPV